jgi:hypothetical protein
MTTGGVTMKKSEMAEQLLECQRLILELERKYDYLHKELLRTNIRVADAEQLSRAAVRNSQVVARKTRRRG